MPDNAAYKRGQRLAGELVEFVERELAADPAAVTSALHGAYDLLDMRTRLIRGEDPWPAPPDEDQDRSN